MYGPKNMYAQVGYNLLKHWKVFVLCFGVHKLMIDDYLVLMYVCYSQLNKEVFL
jgi:hypothetical protein